METKKNDEIICLFFRSGGPYMVFRIKTRIVRYAPQQIAQTIKKNALSRPWKTIGPLLEKYKCMRGGGK